ncbi:hypothetical protein LINGRAHAP2_LOCUS2390, partial [Linum grandiflorum]
MQIESISASNPPLPDIPICEELQEMDIEDRKHPRDLTLQPDYGPSKKAKFADIPLQVSDF